MFSKWWPFGKKSEQAKQPVTQPEQAVTQEQKTTPTVAQPSESTSGGRRGRRSRRSKTRSKRRSRRR